MGLQLYMGGSLVNKLLDITEKLLGRIFTFLMIAVLSSALKAEEFSIPELGISFQPDKRSVITKLRVQKKAVANMSVFLAYGVMFMVTRSNTKDVKSLPVTSETRQSQLREAMKTSGVMVTSSNVGTFAGTDAFIIEGKKASMYQYSITIDKGGRTTRVLLVSPHGAPAQNDNAQKLLKTFQINV